MLIVRKRIRFLMLQFNDSIYGHFILSTILYGYATRQNTIIYSYNIKIYSKSLSHYNLIIQQFNTIIVSIIIDERLSQN